MCVIPLFNESCEFSNNSWVETNAGKILDEQSPVAPHWYPLKINDSKMAMKINLNCILKSCSGRSVKHFLMITTHIFVGSTPKDAKGNDLTSTIVAFLK